MVKILDLIFENLKVLHHTCRRFGFQGGAKKYSPYVYPPIFRGGPGVARCILRVTGVSRGMTGVSFFSNKQKKVRCIF